MKQYAGLDISTKETAICVIDDHGRRAWEGKVPSDPLSIAAALQRHAPSLERAGMETGPMSVWLWHSLKTQNVPIDCIYARHASAALKLQANKTDRNDAAGLANLVRSGWYAAVSMKSLETHKIRALLVVRSQLVGMCTSLINKIRGLSKTFGFVVGAGKGATFYASVRRGIPDDPLVRDLFEELLSTLAELQRRKRALDRRLEALAKNSSVCKRLMTVPGVGSITAISFVCTIEDPNRFRRACDVGAFLGLTPVRYQSGEIDRGGRISKCGDRLTRKLLFEAATVILFRARTSSDIKRWAEGISMRSGSWKARVALARKLATILHRIWRDNVPFQSRMETA